MADELERFCALSGQLSGCKSPDGAKDLVHKLYPEWLVGPECGLIAAFRLAVKDRKAGAFEAALDLWRQPVEAYVTIDEKRQNDSRVRDPSLKDRWTALVAAFGYHVVTETKKENTLRIARAALTSAFRELDSKINSEKAAQLLVDDWLQRDREHLSKETPFAKLESEFEESTPILTVTGAGRQQRGSVVDLVARKNHLQGDDDDGGERLIYPDLLAFGLAELKKGETSFVSEMHRGFRSAPPPAASRFCWHIAPREGGGTYPPGFEGPSAQVAAACCARALVENEPLDRQVAVSARLAEHNVNRKPENWELLDDPDLVDRHTVHEVGLLTEKFEAAFAAKLIAVQICERQFQKLGRGEWNVPKRTHTTLIQPVKTLEDAYQALLITSKAVADYKAGIHKEWLDDWDPQSTH